MSSVQHIKVVKGVIAITVEDSYELEKDDGRWPCSSIYDGICNGLW